MASMVYTDNEMGKFRKNVHLVIDDMSRFYMLFNQKELMVIEKIGKDYDYPSVLILVEEMTKSKPFERIIQYIDQFDDTVQQLYNLCDKENAIRRVLFVPQNIGRTDLQDSFQEELDKVYSEKIGCQEVLLAQDCFFHNFMDVYQYDVELTFMNFTKIKTLFKKLRKPNYYINKNDLTNLFIDYYKMENFIKSHFPNKKLSLKAPYYDYLRELVNLLKKINYLENEPKPSLLDKIKNIQFKKSTYQLL